MLFQYNTITAGTEQIFILHKKYLGLEIIKLAMSDIMQAMTKYYRLIASQTKVIIMNLQILNRDIPRKPLNVCPKTAKNILG